MDAVPIVPSWHVAVPSPFGHCAVKAGCRPAGAAASVTVTPVALPFCTATSTVSEAA